MADTPAPQNPAPPPAAPKPPAVTIKSVKEVAVAGDHFSLAAGPDGDRVFVGGHTGKLQAIDLAAEKPEPIAWDAHVGFVSGLVLTPKFLVSSGSDHQMIWWNRETRERVRAVPHAKWVRHLSLSPDGQVIASVCDDMVCRLWEAETGRPIRELRGHAPLTPFHLRSKLYSSAFSPDGKLLATVDQTGHAFVWETATSRKLADVHAPFFYYHDFVSHGYGGIRAVDFSPDGTRIALGGNLCGDSSIIGGSKSLMQVYDWQTGKQTADCQLGGDFFYERVRFLDAGRWLLGVGGAGGKQVTMVIFDLTTQAIAAEAKLPAPMFDAAFRNDGAECFTAGRGKVCKWTITSGA